MANNLRVILGGTTGAQDGTDVSEDGAFTNALVLSALNTPVSAHLRCDDGYWTNGETFTLPAELEISFNGGAWKGVADNPIAIPEIEDVNYPVQFRQVSAASSTSGSFTNPGTVFSSIAALSTPTLTATVISSTQIDLSWTNVANEDASPGYTIERSPDGSSWSALTTKAANVTTHSDTGLTAGTHYYYRVKAEGSGRYSDSGWGTDDDTTLAAPFTDNFTGSNDTALSAHTPSGATGPWVRTNGSPGDLRIISNRVGVYNSSTAARSCRYKLTDEPSSANCYVQVDCYLQSAVDSYVLLTVRDAGYGSANYYVFLERNGDITLGEALGAASDTDTTTLATQSAGTTRTLRLEANGTSIRALVDGVELVSFTDATITGPDAVSVEIWCSAATSSQNAGFAIDNFEAGNL